MKKTFNLFCCLVLYISSTGQTIHDVNGNIGIGTTNPSSKLHVSVGSPDRISITRSLNTHGILGVSNSSAYLNLSNDGPGNVAMINLISAGAKYWDFGLTDNSTPYTQWQLRENVSGTMIPRITVPLGGNVGIGTTTPTNGKLVVSGSGAVTRLRVENLSASGAVDLLVSNDEGKFSAQQLYGSASSFAFPFNAGAATYYTNGTSCNFINTALSGFTTFFTGGEVAANERMRITANGNVGIGTTNPQAKLAVKGNVFAEKVKVTLAPADWPDYVFEKEYPLLPLSELQKYIQHNHHLPEVATAEEVNTHGLDLGENQAALLRKIEELTLYIIDLNEKIVVLQKKVQIFERNIQKQKNF